MRKSGSVNQLTWQLTVNPTINSVHCTVITRSMQVTKFLVLLVHYMNLPWVPLTNQQNHTTHSEPYENDSHELFGVRYIVFTYLLAGRKKNNNRSSGYKMIVLTNIYRKFIDSDPNVVSV